MGNPPKNALLVGITRDSAATIEQDIRRLFAAVQPQHCFVVESDSSDDTAARLETLSVALPGLRYISLGNLSEAIPSRIDRITHCRNRYLKEIAENPAYAGTDYVVIADLDNINALISREAFLTCFARDDWDACTANQRGPYYDIFALRHDTWSPVDCMKEFRSLVSAGMDEMQSLSKAVYSKMLRIKEAADWIPVRSSFGGFAVYRTKALGSAIYSGRDAQGDETCEHVPFHEALSARMFINPRLINAGYTEHTEQLRFLPRLKLRAKILLKMTTRLIAGDGAVDAPRRLA